MNIHTENIVSVVRNAARQVMPEGKYLAFVEDLHRAAKWLSPLGAIELMATLQNIYKTPAARRAIHSAIADLKKLEER